MNSVTMIGHAPPPGRRQGRSLPCSAYQAVIGSSRRSVLTEPILPCRLALGGATWPALRALAYLGRMGTATSSAPASTYWCRRVIRLFARLMDLSPVGWGVSAGLRVGAGPIG